MGVTKKQKTTLERIGPKGENFNIRVQALEEPVANIDNRLTTFYKSTLEHLEYLDEYFTIFEGRVRRDPECLKNLVLSINRKVNNVKK